eukprot:Nitzschia sp. Nitz4//scaffold139_size61406//31338//32171//NITZ4_006458-RA/size61406-snap-gene-0.3-mRNA-1//1//CDS//3329535846//4235//frame0
MWTTNVMHRLPAVALRHLRPVQTIRTLATQEVIINAVGNDRTGIVSDMTKCVTQVGGNVGASNAATLGSHFSLMMLVQLQDTQIDPLVEELKTLKDLHATVHVVAVSDTPRVAPTIGYTGRFTLEGADHPGIVHKVTSLLANHGLSIDKMETGEDIAPHGGAVLFRMDGVAHAFQPMSSGFDPEKIKEDLETLGNEMNCDMELIDIPENEWKRLSTK